jgi:hypothetical protein
MKMNDIRPALRVSALLALITGTLYAGSTGTTQLHTPQGSGAGTANGDYVSDATALDTSYHYFVEVPSGLARLVIDVYDADVLLGGTAEAPAGRDRERTTVSTARYSVYGPNGTVRNTLFTTGDATTPAGSDAAWTSLFDMTGDTYADNFSTAAYTNNDGTMTWSTNWLENNDDNSAGAGQMRITGGQLRMGDNGDANLSRIEREANLSSFSTATLSFGLNTTGVEATDQMRVEISSNGGASWTTLETFTGPYAAGSTRSYNITPYIATNTRVRFSSVSGYGTNDFFFVDALQIKAGTIANGHWEVRVDMSSAISGGDTINAIGLRAHDGTSGAGGTELNVYADSMISIGANPPASGSTSRAYRLYPYITSGCSCYHNDFDFDSNSTTAVSSAYTNRTAAFTQSFTGTQLSGNDVWSRRTISGFTTDALSDGYGLWQLDASVASYLVGGTPNGNYAVIYDAANTTAANPPTANPVTGGFRIYLPSDAGVAPVKPYLEQLLTYRNGSNPPVVGQTSRYTVTIRITNPAASAITFSASNLINSNVPGGGAVYGGNAAVGQGSIVTQPAVGGTGNISWNPGVLAAGTSSLLSYDVLVTPTSAGQRVPITATAASGSGTRATFVDETGNTTQARATMTLGPICELAATEGLLTEALVASFDARRSGGDTIVEWTTASEAGTIGFHLYRVDPNGGAAVRLDERILAADASAPQGSRYRFVDSSNRDDSPSYLIEEITASGTSQRYGPFTIAHLRQLDDSAPATSFERLPRGRNNVRTIATNAATNANAMSERVATLAKANATAVIVNVRTTGIVRVTAADLASILGSQQQMVAAKLGNGGISVTSRGAAVTWTPSSDGNALLFYGEASDSIYSRDRAYRIELQRGSTMDVTNVATTPTAPPVTFAAVQHAETDAFAATVLPLDPAGDYWFWDYILSGDPTDGHKSFTVAAPSLASDAGATLTVRLQGAIAGVPHRARVTLNGSLLGSMTWSSLNAGASTFSIPAGALHASNNVVTVEGVLEPGSTFDVFYINNFDVSYRRAATADAGRLTMSATAGSSIVANGFTSTPTIFDISNPLQPALLRGAALANGTVAFKAPARVQSLYFAETSAFVAPTSMHGAVDNSLAATSNRADWVVITPAALHASADALAALRQREGLQTFVADVEQIYDEFSGGNSTPLAIRDFIRATASWSRAPRYFVLAGGGTFDYRGLTGTPGLLPPLMTRTSNGLFASDSLFADRDGDGLPDVAIGRIPVQSAAELDAYVAKLDASSRASSNGSRIIYSADTRDRGADFRAASQQVEGVLDRRPAIRIYLDELGASARPQLLDAWHSGAALVSWVGHGGLDRISSAGLLTAADAPTLTSSGPLPVVLAMTCTINRFELGNIYESLGSALTRAPGAGALAVWAASGLSATPTAGELERVLLQQAAKTPTARIGDLIVDTFTRNRSAGETGSIYLLLGDPAIRLSLPPFLPAGGNAPKGGE